MERRKFIRTVGGGVIFAAVPQLAGCGSLSARLPAGALDAWRGPGAEHDIRRRAIAYAITAPNPHNLQPWLVDIREPGVITLRTDPSRILPETDPFGRQILIGHGCFVELLVMGLAQQGWAAEVTLWPQGTLGPDPAQWDARPVARLSLRAGGQPDPLFAHVLNRRTPKVDFDVSRPVPTAVMAQLIAAAARPGVDCGGTASLPSVEALRKLCVDAARIEIDTPRTFMESIRLTRVGPEEILKHRDGISINTPFARAMNTLGLFDRQRPPAPGSQAHRIALSRFESQSQTAMAFLWHQAANTRAAQIEVGRSYVRTQLAATALGVGMHPMSQALQEFQEMRQLREDAHQLTLRRPAPRGAEEMTLQMLCRLGYPAADVGPSPRRPLEHFVAASSRV